MLKVILVDDEPNVRQGIKMMIPWEELDLKVVAEGEDGDDGLNKILIHDPDIVIADVKMPGMTGIQMTEAAQKSGFTGKTVILSGYSDFTYAKESMALGVKQFILKPVDEDELINCLKSLHDEILAERDSTIKLKKGSEYISEQFIRSLLLGDTNYDSEEFDAYNLYDKYCVALISYVPAGAQSSKAFLLDMIKKQLKERGDTDVITTDLNGMLAAVFKGREEGEVRDCLNEISRTYHGRVFITIGNTVRDAGKISVSYSNANDLYGNRFIYLHYGVISSADIKRRGGEEEASGADFGEKLFTFMEINDSARLEGCLAEMQNALCRNSYTPEKIKVICITTVLSIKNLIIKSAGEKKAEQFHDETIIGQIGTLNSLHEIIELMKNELTTVSDNLYGKTTKSTMERIVQYIHANYNRELRLEMLASIFGYNSAYLGKVFHQYMGDNFNNYLDKIRITEAKRLLEEGEYKVYEVAEKVGYTNINYFHNKFKKYVGVSPLNYKKSCKEDEETES